MCKLEYKYSIAFLFSPHGIAMLKGLYFTDVVSSFFFIFFSTPNV